MNNNEGFTFSRREESWIEDNLERLSEMHTDAMKRSWNEDWSNSPLGSDTRRYSPALIRSYARSGGVFFSADAPDGEIAGYGIVLPLNEGYLSKHGSPGEWASHHEWLHPQSGQPFDATELAPSVGDMEMALVITDPMYTNRGIFRRLAEMRLYYAFATLENGRRIWLQTLENSDITTVSRFYKNHGFEVLARVRVKSTVRVVLSQVVNIDDVRVSQAASLLQSPQTRAF